MKPHILFYSNRIAIQRGLPDIRTVEINNGPARVSAILNSIELKISRMHPPPEIHILFYSNGLAI